MNKLSRQLAVLTAVPVLLACATARGDSAKTPEEKPEAFRDLGRIGLSLLQYAEDFGHALPSMTDTDTVAKATKDYYGENEGIFVNGQTGQKYQPNVSLSTKKLEDLKEGGIVLFYESAPSSDNKRWVLVLLPKAGDDYDYSKGGWVRQIDERDWPKLKKASGIK